MAMELKQQMRLQQTLVMTPQLQQAIKLLQLSRLELVEEVRKEMEENPVLEEEAAPPDGAAPEAGDGAGNGETRQVAEVKGDESAAREIDWDNYLEKYSMSPPMPAARPAGGEELPSLEATLTRRPSLSDHLLWQLSLAHTSERERAIASLIIGNLDADGYLRDPPIQDIAADAGVPLTEAEAVLRRVQEFDPPGVAARDLPECLLLQVRRLGIEDDLLERTIREHLSNLEKKNYAAIARDLGTEVEEVIEVARVIASLDPRPGRLYAEEEPVYITPDVYVHRIGEKFFVVPNDDGLPKLKISGFYRAAMADSPKAREYIQDKLRSAQWLIRSIQQRQRTIIRVTESIIKFQREFFEKGPTHLRPLILRDVAEDINMHESTISRVTTNKYAHTPQGIFELKYFFNSRISRTDGDEIASASVREKIREIIAREDTGTPLSDQQIVDMLREQGIQIARRTVAKYREQLGILSSAKRRQLF